MGSKLQVANRLASATGAPKFTVTITKGCGNSQHPIFGCADGRIALLFLACVARHTALGTPSSASRQRLQKRNIGNFRTPKIWVCLARFSPAKPGSNRQVAYNTVSTHQKADQKRVFCGLDLRQMRRKSLPHAAGGQCAE